MLPCHSLENANFIYKGSAFLQVSFSVHLLLIFFVSILLAITAGPSLPGSCHANSHVLLQGLWLLLTKISWFKASHFSAMIAPSGGFLLLVLFQSQLYLIAHLLFRHTVLALSVGPHGSQTTSKQFSLFSSDKVLSQYALYCLWIAVGHLQQPREGTDMQSWSLLQVRSTLAGIFSVHAFRRNALNMSNSRSCILLIISPCMFAVFAS